MVKCSDKEHVRWIMFDRVSEMDQRSESVPLSDPPLHFRRISVWGSHLGEYVFELLCFKASVNLTNYLQTHVLMLNLKALQCVSASCPQHHGGVGLLPGSGSDLFFWGDESIEGRCGGAERPRIHECVLPVCVGSAVVSGVGRIHWHGYLPPHSPGVLQLPALEEYKTTWEEQRTEKEDKVITRTLHCSKETVEEEKKEYWFL